MIGGFRQRLTREANSLAGYYGAPVYLVGSALQPEKRLPRDFDLRIMLTDADFRTRYGGSAEDWEDQGRTGDWQAVRWRHSDDCVKQSKHASDNCWHMVDVQVYPESYFKRFNKPRVRLDTRGLFAATIIKVER